MLLVFLAIMGKNKDLFDLLGWVVADENIPEKEVPSVITFPAP